MILSFITRCSLLLIAGLSIVSTAVILKQPLMLLPLLALVFFIVYLKHVGVILYIVTLVAFTRIDAWLTMLSGIPFGSLVVGLTMFSLLAIMVLTGTGMNRPGRSFLLLTAYYAGATAIGTLFGETAYFSEWARDSFYAFLVFSTVYLLASDERRITGVMNTIIACGIILSLLNIIEVIMPGTIRLSHSTGRAAGLLKNSNASAIAILCSYLIYSIRTRAASRFAHHGLFILLKSLFFLGILATFSREGIILLVLALISQNIVDARNRSAVVRNYIAVAFTFFTAFYILNYLLTSKSALFLPSYYKIYSLLHGSIDDNNRLFLLKYYLSKYSLHPLFGFGFYSTILPSSANNNMLANFGVHGPHNTFVAILTDFGPIPLALYIMLYLSMILDTASIKEVHVRNELLILVGLLAAHNLFSHDILTTRYIMVLLALICVMPIGRRRTPNRTDDLLQNDEKGGRS